MVMDLIRDGIAAVQSGQSARGRELLYSALEQHDIPSSLRASLLIWISETYDDVDYKLKLLNQAAKISPFNPDVNDRIAYYSQYIGVHEKHPPFYEGTNGISPFSGRNYSGEDDWYPTAMSAPLSDNDNREESGANPLTISPLISSMEPAHPQPENTQDMLYSGAYADTIRSANLRQTATMPHIDKARRFVQRRAQQPGRAGNAGLWTNYVDSTEAIELLSGDVVKSPVAGQKSRHNWYLYTIIWVSGFLMASVLMSLSSGLRGFILGLVPEALGIVFTVGVLERMASRRAVVELKKQLIHQTGSRANEIAKSAVDRIRAEGWLVHHSILAGQNLRRANLEGAYLKDANLSRANLEISNFNKAYLVNANLSRCKLNGAFFIEARLVGAGLRHADLSNARMMGADLRNADLTGANLTGADLSGADVRGIILTDAITSNVNWKGVIQS